MELLYVEREICADAGSAWALVSDFAGLPMWNPLVAECMMDGEGVGAVRHIRYPDGIEVREQLVGLNHIARVLRYLFLSGAAIPVLDLTGEISITPSPSDKCRVGWRYFAEYQGESWQLAEFVSHLASRTVRRISDLEIAATFSQN